MRKNYTPSDQRGNFFSNGSMGFLATFIVFCILPLMHILGNIDNLGPNTLPEDSSLQPPPPPPEELPPPPEEEEEQEPPEMEEPPPPMTLEQLELALNPGDGGVAGEFGFDQFNANVNAADAMKIFDLKDLDQKPDLLFKVEPNYPYNLKQQRISGWADVYFVINANGRVSRVRVTKSTHKDFNQAAIDAVNRSKWKPGKKDGRAVATQVTMRVDFTTGNW